MYENIKTVETGGLPLFVGGFLKGALISVALTLGVFAVFALLLSYTALDEGAVRYISYATEALGALVAGLIPAKKLRRKGILTGGLSGVLYMVIIWTVSSLVSDGFFFNTHVLIMFLTALISGAFGGIVGVNMKNPETNKKKR